MQTIRVLGFFQKTTLRDGKPVLHDWVRYAPLHAVQTVVNEERVDRLMPKDAIDNDPDKGDKANFIRTRWGEIEPYYSAWKAGNEVPEVGTPLAAWPGVTPEQAQALRASNLRTVEEVASIPDHALSRTHLPNMRDLRNQAKAFLEARGSQNVADELAAARAKADSMQEQLDEALKMLAELTAPGEGQKRGRKPKAVEAVEPEDADAEGEAA